MTLAFCQTHDLTPSDQVMAGLTTCWNDYEHEWALVTQRKYLKRARTVVFWCCYCGLEFQCE